MFARVKRDSKGSYYFVLRIHLIADELEAENVYKVIDNRVQACLDHLFFLVSPTISKELEKMGRETFQKISFYSFWLLSSSMICFLKNLT